MTKRRFLTIISGAIVGIFTLPYLKPRLHQLLDFLTPQLPGPPNTGALSTAETETIVAYADVLVDSTALSDESRDLLKRHVDDRTHNEPGYLSLYKMTAAFLDRLAKSEFSRIPRAERMALLEKHGLMSCRVHRRECLSPFGAQKRMIRALAAVDLVGAYYRSAGGWAVVGYAAFPGRCGDLTRYTHAEA